MKLALALCPALVAALSTASPALAEAIVTDRPDIAESSLAVGRAVYQLEQGATMSPAGLAFPSLSRLGLGGSFELRFETPWALLGNGAATLQPLAAGAKWHVLDGGEWGQLPSLALLGHGEYDPSAGSWTGIGKLLADTALPADFDLGLNLGGAWTAGRPAPAWTYAASISHDLPAPGLRGYLEASGEQDLQGAPAVFGVDGGVAYLLDDDTQLDGALYRGLSAGAEDWYLTLGYSRRFGQKGG